MKIFLAIVQILGISVAAASLIGLVVVFDKSIKNLHKKLDSISQELIEIKNRLH
jgi:hypothetical protein